MERAETRNVAWSRAERRKGGLVAAASRLLLGGFVLVSSVVPPSEATVPPSEVMTLQQNYCAPDPITITVSIGDGSTAPPGSLMRVLFDDVPFPGSWTRQLGDGTAKSGAISMTGAYFGTAPTFYNLRYFPSNIPTYSCGPTVNCNEPEGAAYQCTGGGNQIVHADSGNIKGRVSKPDGSAAAGVVVAAYSDDPNHVLRGVTITDDNGDYDFLRELTGLPEVLKNVYVQNNWGLWIYNQDAVPPDDRPESASFIVVTGGTRSEPAAFDAANAVDGVVVSASQTTTLDLETDDLILSGRSCPTVPLPISVATGNVFLDQTDIAIPGIGRGLRFVRSYNSQNAQSGGIFGPGWTHSYEQKVTPRSTSTLALAGADGIPTLFKDPAASGTYAASIPFTKDSSIVSQPDGSFVRSFRGGGAENYDVQGRLTAVTDASGNTTTLGYDGSGQLVTVTDPGGRTLTLAYTSGRVTTLSGPGGLIATFAYQGSLLQSVTYADGSGYTFTYDGSNQLLTVTDMAGVVIETHTYSGSKGLTSERSNGVERYTLAYATNRTTVTDALGNVTVYDYDGFGGIKRTTKITGPCIACGGSGSLTQEFTYDDAGRVLTRKDGLGNTTAFAYDANGDLLSETDALSHSTSYTRDAQGRVLTRTDAAGGVTTYTHGAAGPLTVTDAVSRTTTLAYDAQGRLQSVTDPRGKTTTFGYDSFGNLISTTDPLSNATSFGYDSLGRRTTVVDPLSHTTTTTYDSRGRVTRVTAPDGTHTDFTYDLGGRRKSAIDPLGRATAYGYDAYGRLSTVTDPLGGTTTYGYDVMSNMASLTDARGKATAFEYDAFKRVKKVTYPGGAFETLTYDLAGRLSTRTDRKGVVTTHSYDAVGNLLGRSYSDGTPAVSYTYDAANRTLTAANGTDTLAWSYDLAGQVLSENSAKNASTVAYNYDGAGNRLTVGLDGPLFVTYAYDDANRLTSITRGSSAFSLAYDAANRRTSLEYPNGVTTTYSYDVASRLTNLTAASGSTTVTSSTYSYDAAGNRTSKSMPGLNEGYSYDVLQRLERVVRSGASQDYSAYGYDAVGNRTSSQSSDGVTTSAYNDHNELVSRDAGGPMVIRGQVGEQSLVTVNGQAARMLPGNAFEATVPVATGSNTVSVVARDGSGNARTSTYTIEVSGDGATYTYDPNGNLATKSEGGTAWSYTFDAENRLTRVVKDGAEAARFSYDALGRRVEKVASGVTFLYVYDGPDIFRESVSASSVFRYVHGPAIDEPLAREDVSAGVTTHYHADGLGSIVRMTDAAGAVALTRQYDAWGNLEAGASEPGYAFTGREWDPETGLYYYRARYYDPKIGRFISEDPIGFDGGINFYAYVGSNPVNDIDPTGLICKSCGIRKPPEYSVSGTVPGGTEFTWSAEFMKDAEHDPTCCEVRQLISWEGRDTPPHRGFPSTTKPGEWYEDRDSGNTTRYGRRKGRYSNPGEYDRYTGNKYSGKDQPSGFRPGTRLRFRLIVVDVCNGNRTIYTSQTITVAF